jgi:uncharacterized protein (TIGR01777 family)
MTPFFGLLILQTLIGGFDNLWHHEITERLPAKRSAARELALHAGRELIYGCIFIQLAWFELRGAWTILMVALLATEIVITLADFVVEDRTRQLPALERVLHTVLAINFGMVLVAFAPILKHWWLQPTEIVRASYGAYSWLFSLFAVGVLGWSVRNALAVLRLRRPPEWVRNPIFAYAIADANSRTVLVSGGTGFVGGHLIRSLLARGDRVIVLTRDTDRALNRFGPQVRIITATSELDTHDRIDAVINLAGAPILGLPWTQARRRKLIDSRVFTTRALVDLCGRLARPPRVFITASAIGYYGLGGDDPLDENHPAQDIFQSRLCQEWEAAAEAARDVVSRVVKLRIGLVLGRDGGALPQLSLPVRFGLGAVLGNGRQWVSWIHIDDLVRLFEFALDAPTLRGVLNAVSPAPATHAQLQRTLARVLHRPLWLHIPAFFIRTLMGEMSQLLVDGQRVIPTRAVAVGFTFKHPNLGEGLAHLLGNAQESFDPASADIYYNGECPVCRTEMEHYASLCATPHPRLRFVDSTRAPDELAACGLRREHLERRVYIRDGKGQILSGMPAIIALWARMPRYSWLARLFSLPLLKQATVLMYDHVIAPSLALWARSRSNVRQRPLDTRGA